MRWSGFLLLMQIIENYNMKNFWNLPTASTNIIFWVIVRKIIVLISSLVHILIVKNSINYRTFLNLHSLYHRNKLQLKEVLVWTILEENLQQKSLISQRVVYNNATMKHASSLHEYTIPNSYILKRKSKFTCQIRSIFRKTKKQVKMVISLRKEA